MKVVAWLIMLTLAVKAEASPLEAERLKREQVLEVARALERGEAKIQFVKTTAAILKLASLELKRKGAAALASQVEGEWLTTYQFAVFNAGVGDHAPLNQWLVATYLKIEAVLGHQVCHLLRIDDLWYLAYETPVAFKPEHTNQWCLETEISGGVCRDEYRIHVAGEPTLGGERGFAGIVTYWTLWSICEGATYGTGYFVVCAPIGAAGEILMQLYIAPSLADKIYDRKNPNL